MSIEWSFNLELKRVIEATAATAPTAAGKAMEHIREVAAVLTPVGETGNLMGSATVTVDGDTASITYDSPYARYLHEGLIRHWAGGETTYWGDLHFEKPTAQAKFLEQPMNSERDTALAMIAKDIREAL